jgi:hypothetical protein
MLAISVGIKAKCPLRKIMQSKKVSCVERQPRGQRKYVKKKTEETSQM